MMMSFFKINKSRGLGFSLIELMIVVAIVGILASLAFPAYTQYMLRGKRAEGRAILMDAAAKMEKHYGDCYQFGNTIAAARNCAAGQVDLCGANLTALGCPSTTFKYNLTINAAATNAQQYVLDATPVPPAMIDPACDVLQVMSTGQKCANINGVVTCSNASAAAAAAVDDCWGR